MYNYKNKLITVEEAVRFVKSGDDIVTGLGPAVAHGFMSKLHTVAEKVSGVTVNVSLCLNSYDFLRIRSIQTVLWRKAGFLRLR